MTSFPLQARASERLGQGGKTAGGADPYFDQFTGGIMHLGLEKIDVRWYVMSYISLLAD